MNLFELWDLSKIWKWGFDFCSHLVLKIYAFEDLLSLFDNMPRKIDLIYVKRITF